MRLPCVLASLGMALTLVTSLLPTTGALAGHFNPTQMKRRFPISRVCRTTPLALSRHCIPFAS